MSLSLAATQSAKNDTDLVDNPGNTHKIEKTSFRQICQLDYVAKTVAHFSKRKKLLARNMTYPEAVKELNKVVYNLKLESPIVFSKEKDIRRPFWLYTFGLFCGLTYCESQEDVERFADRKDLKGPLPTGSFKVLDWEEFPAYSGRFRTVNDNDGFFLVTVNKDLQLLTLSWRGSERKNDFLADMSGTLLGMDDVEAEPFRLNSTITKRECQLPKDQDDFFYFAGFLRTMNRHVMDKVKLSL